MDWPILKQVDILIGIAVVMLLASTVVTAATQLYLNVRRARSEYLREKLEDLVEQLAPELSRAEAFYVAERLLRHPLVGRRRVIPDFVAKAVAMWRWLAKWFGMAAENLGNALASLPMPRLARGEVILRHEIVLTLLEWAAGDGPLSRQDRQMLETNPALEERLQAIRAKLVTGLRAAGVADPAQAARDLRRQFVENENANPAQASHIWQTQALVTAGLGDLTGRVFAWYDQSMERVTEFFSLEAKAAASVISLVLCFVVQLDSVDLLRRLSQDDKFRAAMVAQAELAKTRYENLQKDAQQNQSSPPAEQPGERKDTQNAGTQVAKNSGANKEATLAEMKEAEQKVREAVATLRDPKMAIVPEHTLFEKVQQTRIARGDFRGKLRVRVDQDAFPILTPADCSGDHFPGCLVTAIRAASPPVETYEDKDAVVMVAQSTRAGVVTFEKETAKDTWNPVEGVSVSRGWDKLGFRRRLPGVLLSWVLLSLGAPFWYDLLKKLLGLRSLLQNREEADRKARQESQATNGPEAAKTVDAPGAPSALQGEPGAVVLDRDTALRAEPSMQAAVTRDFAAGHPVNVVGFVMAQAAAAGGNAKWHRTVEGDYVWDGAVRAQQ